jgi:hypothetical protein
MVYPERNDVKMQLHNHIEHIGNVIKCDIIKKNIAVDNVAVDNVSMLHYHSSGVTKCSCRLRIQS